MQTMEAGLCSARTPSSQEESGDEELSVLPRHTKVIVTGNNRTKSVLVGLQGVVKKAVGLGGWHWLVLKNGVEVKLQRNALSVLEAPTGNEDEDDDIDCDNSFCSSSDMGDKDVDYSSLEFHKPTKPRVRHTRPWTSSSAKSNGRGSNHRDAHSNGHNKPQMRLNLAKLGTPALWRYWRHFNLVCFPSCPHHPPLEKGERQPQPHKRTTDSWCAKSFAVAATGRDAGYRGVHPHGQEIENPLLVGRRKEGRRGR